MQEIVNTNSKVKYTVGRFLGKGGFAKCFLLTDKNDEEFAGKVIPKISCKKSLNKEKLIQEITIHGNLEHENIVKFVSHFEDEKNVYIVLELCTQKSMAELLKRRKTLLVPETRYYTKQIVLACQYLHENLIIHRDLKLANVFLDYQLRVKVGDFGLAAKLNCDDEVKKTMCGTPNYMAPEVLTKDGHSFEVDIWSIGVIIYTLIIGKSPFDTDNLKATYRLIMSNQYSLPYDIEDDVQNIISSTLQSNAKSRPCTKKLLEMEFFKNFTPASLPLSSLSCPPRFEGIYTSNKIIDGQMFRQDMEPINDKNNKYYDLLEVDNKIKDLMSSTEVFASLRLSSRKPCERMAESEDPKLAPVFWISSWVDNSPLGFSYKLNDNSSGAQFHDKTVMLLISNNTNIQYIDTDGLETMLDYNNFPSDLTDKIALMETFVNYMDNNLLKAGLDMVNLEAQSMARLPYVKNFLRNHMAVMFHLNNGTLQVNFLTDHIKVIICPIMEAITFIGGPENAKTFNFHSLKRNGISKDIFLRLKAVRKLIQQFLEQQIVYE